MGPNPRCSPRQGGTLDKTHPVTIAIGERRKPEPSGRPGFLRVDSVHQGDLDSIKGLYHLNLVDEVTQFQFLGSLERISEHFLLPLLEALIESFPFLVRGFHADNGSEYINHRVAKLLEKLCIREFTKSRSRQSNDNALVESKNGSVVRNTWAMPLSPGASPPRSTPSPSPSSRPISTSTAPASSPPRWSMPRAASATATRAG